MENKHLYHTTPAPSNKVQHSQNPKYFTNQHPGYNQGLQPGPQNHHLHQYQGGSGVGNSGQFNSLPIPRKGGDSSNSAPHSQRYPKRHTSTLNPPFPTTDITFTTHSPPTASLVPKPSSYQGRHQDQVTNLQKLQPPGAGVGGGPADRSGGTGSAGGGSERGGLYTYPPRQEPKQYHASDNASGKGQVHSLDRYNNYQQKPQTFVNQQHTGPRHVQDSYSNSLPRVAGHPQAPQQAGFPISPNSPAGHPAPTTYTKHDRAGGFPQQLHVQQNGGAFHHKNTDGHINAPSVQTNANLRAEQPYTQSIASSQRYPPQHLVDSSVGTTINNRPNGGFNTIGYDSRNHPINSSFRGGQKFPNHKGLQTNQSWDSINGSEGRIGSPVSVKVGSQGSSVSGDSDAAFPRANSTSRPTTPSSLQLTGNTINHHTPVIHNFPHQSVYNNNNVNDSSSVVASPVPSVASTNTLSSVGSINSPSSGQVLPFSTELSPQKPSGDLSFDNWSFGNFHTNMMANASDQMRAMEENMKRMQKHMEEQFKNFNMNHPTAMAPPEGFPPLMVPPQAMAIQGINEPLVQGVPAPVPNFTPQPSPGFAAMTGGPPNSVHSTPSSTMTRSSSSGLPPGSFHPGMDTMELNRCIQGTPDGKKHLQLKFDMQDFKPEEVSVKKDKNKLEVHAHHEEKEPNRVACKVFHQQYHLPKNVRLAKMEYAMDPEGTLTVQSPVKPRHNVKWEEGQKLEQTKLIQPRQ